MVFFNFSGRAWFIQNFEKHSGLKSFSTTKLKVSMPVSRMHWVSGLCSLIVLAGWHHPFWASSCLKLLLENVLFLL